MNGKGAGRYFIAWGLYLCLYLLLAGSSELAEVIAGAITATLSLLLVARLKSRFRRTTSIKAVWLIYLFRIPLSMLTESCLLLVALLKRLGDKETTGVFIEHHCPGCEYDRHDAARRAFMTFGICVTPNSYLVSWDRKSGTVLLRQLVGKEISPVDRVFVELP
jgi:hypothetical protein